MSPSGSPSTLTDMLRSFSNNELVDLLLARPDLASPTLRSLSDLAARATTRHSVASAVDSLNAFELEVAREIATSPGPLPLANAADVLSAVGQRPPSTETLQAVERLRGLALIWVGDSALRPVRALPTVLVDTSAGEPRAAPAVSPWPQEPADVTHQPHALVAKVAAGSAFESVRRMDVLLEHCAAQPVQLRRDGAVAVRELTVVAELLDVPTKSAQWYLHLAEAAGLLGVSWPDGAEVLSPSTEFPGWAQRSLAEQWRVLACTWRDEQEASAPRWLKQLCLAAFGDPLDGRVVPNTGIRDWIVWHRPRSAPIVRRLTDSVLHQAAELGLLGLGALACYAAPIETTSLEALLPSRTEEVLLQADLTAVAPGPLTPEAARELGAIADIESRGGATVYRFSSATVRRGLSRGWNAERIVALLTKRSRTAVPQPLAYLVHDAARVASSSDSPTSSPVEALQQRPHSEPGRPRSSVRERSAFPLDRPAAEAVIKVLRSADSELAQRLDGSPVSDPVPQLTPVEALREAAETGETLWLSATDSEGRIVERLVTVEDVDAGTLHSVDARSGQACRLPVRRILAAHILRGSRKAH